jgi:hypothetical protein
MAGLDRGWFKAASGVFCALMEAKAGRFVLSRGAAWFVLTKSGEMFYT